MKIGKALKEAEKHGVSMVTVYKGRRIVLTPDIAQDRLYVAKDWNLHADFIEPLGALLSKEWEFADGADVIETERREKVFVVHDIGEDASIRVGVSDGGEQQAWPELAKKKPACFGGGGVPKPKKKEPGRDFRGFVHVQCGHCGETRTFYSKGNMKNYLCRSCGQKTDLWRGAKAMITCPCCGKGSVYATNAEDDTVTIRCVECGAPCDAQWSKKDREYKPMK